MSKTLFVTPWTITHQAPLSMGFSREKYRSGLPVPSWRGSSWPRDRTRVSCTACVFFTTEPPGNPYRERCLVFFCFESVQRKHWQCKYETGLSSALFLHCFCIISSFLLPPGTLTYNYISNRIHMQRSHSFLFLAQTSSFTIHPLHCQAA